MKKIFNLILVVSVTLFGLTSCLKDKDYNDQKVGLDLSKSPQIVEFKQSPEADVVVNVSTTPLNATLLTVATGANVKEDVTVTIIKDDALVTAAGYGVLAPTEYTLPALTVTIPKGKNTVDMPISLKNTALLLGTNFALGFKIGTVSNSNFQIGTNYQTVVCPIVVQNEYAGCYTSNGFRQRYNGPTEATGLLGTPFDNVNVTKCFTTSSAKGISGGLADGGSGVSVDLVIGANGTSLSVIATAGVAPALVGTDIKDPAKTSSYNPATKTYTIFARYLNAAGNLRIAEETLVKQ